MQNSILKLKQSSVISEKPDNLSGKFKILKNSDYHIAQYFFAKSLHTFPN